MVYFRADEQGNIACATFLMMFLKIGFDERQERTNLYRKQEAELAELRAKEALTKAKQAEAKLAVRVKGINTLYQYSRTYQYALVTLEHINTP